MHLPTEFSSVDFEGELVEALGRLIDFGKFGILLLLLAMASLMRKTSFAGNIWNYEFRNKHQEETCQCKKRSKTIAGCL
jgi:hypothetical protein